MHTARSVMRFGKEAVRKGRRLGFRFDARIDAGYTDRQTLDDLTDRKVRLRGRLKSNAVLERPAAAHLQRPVGRPPLGGYEDVIELG